MALLRAQGLEFRVGELRAGIKYLRQTRITHWSSGTDLSLVCPELAWYSTDKGQRDLVSILIASITNPYEPLSKLLVSPLITLMVVPYTIPYITPLEGVQTIVHIATPEPIAHITRFRV